MLLAVKLENFLDIFVDDFLTHVLLIFRIIQFLAQFSKLYLDVFDSLTEDLSFELRPAHRQFFLVLLDSFLQIRAQIVSPVLFKDHGVLE